jgi:tRNA-specific 2-thiouridylase
MPSARADLSRYKGKKVAVAMSGGVDSSVAAFLLKKAGADVFGITMKTVPGSTCCSQQDINDAKAVAKSLKIPHHIVELGELFKKTAIDYFVSESLEGKNPNPCVPCNQKVKFGALVEEAEKLGAEYFATGHYARIENGLLKRPVDIKKDQSYVLSMLPRKIFAKLIFPIGDYTKDDIRKIAELNKIKVFAKQENQDLCFLHKEKGEFIEELTQTKCRPGKRKDSWKT